ncbi:Uma2 family endonuclease [Tautonia sp. JC769]|uniref:Uma2 family endonuclease n=1 Tax=Tautonia sp. JC769 TaxID=3232135 RepID=UPI00345A34F5
MPTTAPVSPSAEPPMQPITVAMFREMVRSGIVGEKEPVYLWKGRLARRKAPNRPHSIAVDRSRRALESVIPPGFHAQQGQAVAMRTEHSTPEPDLAVLRGRPDDFPNDFPTTADLSLVVEVADSSIAPDRDQAGDFAREGIPAYWIVDLKGRRIEAHDSPDHGTYQRTSTFSESNDIPVVIDGREVGRLRVLDLLPPR